MSGWRYALSLSKAEVKNATPPGTQVFIETIETQATIEDVGEGKHARLIPSPSDDPADPLNWPMWRKIALLIVASFYAFVANFNSSVVAPALPIWPVAFPHEPKPQGDLPYLVAVNVLFLGVSNLFWVPLSSSFGRRPVLISASLIMTLCTVWCALASDFDTLLAARIFQAIGGGPADAVSPALVGDTFFLHQRGRAMAVFNIFIAASPLVAGISGGYIGFLVGWKYIFWVSLALSGAVFVGVIIFVPESLYDREPLPAPVEQAHRPGSDSGGSSKELPQVQVIEYRPFTFARSLGFRKPRGRVIQNFIEPWRTLRLPATWITMLQYGGVIGGMVSISVIGPQILAESPYNWGSNVGLVNIGGMIGLILGAAFTYSVADAWLQRQARRHTDGYAEPEDRLPTMYPTLIIATAGFFVFGFCADNPGTARWIGLQVGYGMLSFGCMQIPSIGFNYLIDAYSTAAADCFVMTTSLRSVVAFAWTLVVSDWAHDRGPAEPFGIFGMLMGLFGLLTVPLWFFGKRIRIATASFMAQ